jgi:hypothetical protein
MELFLSFIAGMIVMDLMWALKLGIPQSMLAAYRQRQETKENKND